MASASCMEFTNAKIEFASYRSFVDGPADMPFNNTTISTWFRLKSLSANSVIIAHGNGEGIANGLYLLVNNLGVIRYTVKLGSVNLNITGSTVSINTWYHVAAVSASDSDHRFYLNGVLDGSSTTTKTPTETPTQWSLGRYAGSGHYYQTLGGYLAYPAFYKNGFNVDEVNEIMRKPFSIVKDLMWAPNTSTTVISSIGDIKDLSGLGYNCNDYLVNLPVVNSTLGSPVYFPDIN